ncbi:MAG: hypothetical protein GC199_07035 [Alphaproteobacteria bacterium]|nr:hypothetical protein [Alphaproteobacteria bacterium]
MFFGKRRQAKAAPAFAPLAIRHTEYRASDWRAYFENAKVDLSQMPDLAAEMLPVRSDQPLDIIQVLDDARSHYDEINKHIQVVLDDAVFKRIEGTSAPLALDLQRKIELLGSVLEKVVSVYQIVHDFMSEMENEGRTFANRSEEDRINQYREFLGEFFGRLNAILEIYSDYAHYLDMADYQSARGEIAKMSAADQRLLSVFYTNFQTAFRVVHRVLTVNVPGIMREANSVGEIVIAIIGRLDQIAVALLRVLKESVPLFKQER